MTGAEAAARLKIATDIALKAVAEELLARAVKEAPIGPTKESGGRNEPGHPGLLRGSGRVDMGEGTATVSFNTVYAARQHEEITWKHPQGGKAKYLEDPLKAIGPELERALALAMRKALG